MSWAQFYLICFVVGFAFSVLSFVLGGLHWHLPFGLHLPDLSGGHLLSGAHAAGAHGASGHAHISPFNPATIAAFLAWFGGTGYLLTRYSTIWLIGGFAIAVVMGLIGASIVFLFLTRVLTSEDENLDPADFEMVGVLGRISMPIRAGGTGEIIYSQAGTRRACGARADDGTAMAKGSEVVVTRYEKGIAYVRLWSEMSGEG
jgi:hypothetical protein